MRFLHISDLHYFPEQDGRENRWLRCSLPEFIRDNNISVDYLFITGDFRDASRQKLQSQKDAAKEAVDYIKKIADALDISPTEYAERIHIVPGNHDRTRCDKKPIDDIIKSYNLSSGTISKKDTRFLRSHFSFFDEVCNLLYGKDNPWKTSDLHITRPIKGYTLLCLNTAITHNNDSDREHLIVCNDEIDRHITDIRENSENKDIIVLAHHSRDYFSLSERHEVAKIFARANVRLYLCGDAHKMWVQKIDSCLEITAGCIKTDENTDAAIVYGSTADRYCKVYKWDGNTWSSFKNYEDRINSHLGGKEKPLTGNEIRESKNLTKNSPLLPWVMNGIPIGSVFPELYINITVTSSWTGKQLTALDLPAHYGKSNIVIAGDAGCGKSTLLKNIFLYHNEDDHFLYLHASSLKKETIQNACEKKTLSLLRNGSAHGHYTIFLDGMDEIYSNDRKRLSDLVGSLLSLKNVSIWFGWRLEDYKHAETDALRSLVKDVFYISEFSEKQVLQYVEDYAEKFYKPYIIKKFKEIIATRKEVLRFSQGPFRLILLVYLIEYSADGLDIDSIVSDADKMLYAIYDEFFRIWIKNEKSRGTSSLSETDIRNKLYDYSRAMYSGEHCAIETTDTAVRDMFIFASEKDHPNLALRFQHRSLCAFFFADGIFQMLKKGKSGIKKALYTPLKNDVTDFLRSAISSMHDYEKNRLVSNLKHVYKQTLLFDRFPRIYNRLFYLKRTPALSRKDSLSALKNEILFLLTRITSPSSEMERFMRDAYRHESDPYLKLDIAYGAALVGPSEVALDYADKLIPGSIEDIVQRSWTMAYYGDVAANPLDFRDNGTKPWDKARTARLDRLASSSTKALRFRLFDLPVLYCFYESRGWQNIDPHDIAIITAADITNTIYSSREKEYLSYVKTLLVSSMTSLPSQIS